MKPDRPAPQDDALPARPYAGAVLATCATAQTARLGFFRSSWRSILIVSLIAVAIALLYDRIDVNHVLHVAQGIDPVLAFTLLVVLPVLGFPVSVLQVVAGVRFGTAQGLMLVTVAIVIQLLASFALVHLFRRPFARWLAPLTARVPQKAHGTMCLFTMLLPGVPYFAKNYALPLLGVPLRPYLAWCLPVHFAHAIVGVAIGGHGGDLTFGKILGVGIYGAAVVLVSWWMWRRLRSQT